MSQFLTMELYNEGPAKVVPGDLESGDLYFDNYLPRSFDEVARAARVERVPSIFSFAEGTEEAMRQAQIAVYGKPEDELDPDSGDPEPTEELDAEVDRVYYSTGPWFTPEEGRRTAAALARHFAAYPTDLPYDLDEMRDSLDQFVAALGEAERRGRRFRLHYSY